MRILHRESIDVNYGAAHQKLEVVDSRLMIVMLIVGLGFLFCQEWKFL